MSYDEGLAERVRDHLRDRSHVVEKRMFGGLCFMVAGHMCVGIVNDELMARVGPDQYEMSLARPQARPMDFTGRPLTGMVYVATAGVRTKASLGAWIDRCLDFIDGLPEKKAPSKPRQPRHPVKRTPRGH